MDWLDSSSAELCDFSFQTAIPTRPSEDASKDNSSTHSSWIISPPLEELDSIPSEPEQKSKRPKRPLEKFLTVDTSLQFPSLPSPFYLSPSYLSPTPFTPLNSLQSPTGIAFSPSSPFTPFASTFNNGVYTPSPTSTTYESFRNMNLSYDSLNSPLVEECMKSYGMLKGDSDIFKNGEIFSCPYPTCNKAFVKQYNLNSHLKVHQNDKPYRCTLCVFAFKRKHDLVRHRRLVHKICPNCEVSFENAYALNSHLGDVHGQVSKKVQKVRE